MYRSKRRYWRKNAGVCVGFMDLVKAYDGVINKALGEILRMCDAGGKLLNGIESMHAC